MARTPAKPAPGIAPRTSPDVEAAMGHAAARAAALGHRLGRFTIELAGRAGNKHITIWGACCRCRGDAEVFVKLTARPDTGHRSVTIHGPALEEPHAVPLPEGYVPPGDVRSE